jgi:hypothetical protein
LFTINDRIFEWLFIFKFHNINIGLAVHVSVFFWVLALDHDLRVANDIIGSVFVLNPAGTKVALWEEVALDEGKESHCTSRLCISSP